MKLIGITRPPPHLRQPSHPLTFLMPFIFYQNHAKPNIFKIQKQECRDLTDLSQGVRVEVEVSVGGPRLGRGLVSLTLRRQHAFNLTKTKMSAMIEA